MNNDTFQHGRFYRITLFGKLNPDFQRKGNFPITLQGRGGSVWFIGLAWKPAQFLLKERILKEVAKATRTSFYLIASNYFQLTKMIYVEHNEMSLKKKDRVKTIEPFTLKQFPTLIGTRTTTMFERLLRGEKINLKGFSEENWI